MRFKGNVEQARKDLRNMGCSTKDARDKAPRLAEMRQAEQDRQARPYAWLGGASSDNGSDD